MDKRKNTVIFAVIFVIMLLAVGGYLLYVGKTFLSIDVPFVDTSTPASDYSNPTPISTVKETSIKYVNDQYSFDFSLPMGWKGYSIVVASWEGYPIDGENGQKVRGPEILIRHPLWTSLKPRQDIPIMIFTFAQWSLIQQEKLSLGAAPIGPTELGRNANYVFALPARYNFAFPEGFEEVEKIIADKSFRAF